MNSHSCLKEGREITKQKVFFMIACLTIDNSIYKRLNKILHKIYKALS